MTPHDDPSRTWTAPGGEVFRGSRDYIDGCRAGWEARSWTAADVRGGFYIRGFESGVEHANKKHAAGSEHAHPDDIATHRDGGTW